MIYGINGKVTGKKPGHFFVDIGSGVIIDIITPISYFSDISLEDKVFFYTITKIKDEDIFLYGFKTEKEKEFFLKMISISGIGKKTALLVMSSFSLSEFFLLVENTDVTKLSSIPGLGKKTSERIIFELSGKLNFETEEADENSRLKNDLISALTNLGYPSKKVKDIVNEVVKQDISNEDTFESLFKTVIKKVSGI
ncbi:MAG: Holliday junction branch migration protein RuvA [Acidobacteriota bacterium]